MRFYLSKRKIKSHQYPFLRCIIPKDLQENFDGITDFSLSLSYVRNEDAQILCLKLKKITDKLFTEITNGMKNLSLDDIKEILRIEVRIQKELPYYYSKFLDEFMLCLIDGVENEIYIPPTEDYVR